MHEDRVEALAAILHGVGMEERKRQGVTLPLRAYHELPESIKEYTRVVARFVLAHCDEFSIHNLLGLRPPPGAAREVGA